MTSGRRAGRAAAASIWVGSVLCLAGCAGATVRSNFAGDFRCDEDIDVTETAPNRFLASGCGRDAIYQCVGTFSTPTCVLDAVNLHETPSSIGTRRVGTQPVARPSRDEAALSADDGGAAGVKLSLQLDKNSILKLKATPGKKSPKVLLRLMHLSSASRYAARSKASKCELGWLMDGQRIQAPAARRSRKNNIVTYRARLPLAFVRELGLASRLSLRTCDRRWVLGPERLAEIREFVDQYEEELVWQGEPGEGRAGGLAAPRGGWPDWTQDGAQPMPAAAAGAPLDATALFKKLERSVYKVEATVPTGTAQGSAVAVTETELLTNCHIVQRARKIVLKHGKKKWVVKLSRTDPATDRCVLSVAEPALTPIGGVRTWDSLETGEPLYALGSPAGLELSLSSGILSGRREEGDIRLIQTTAPISPGSSGGGLFDARGNLVGITTLSMIGRKRLNQALNFAIPAARFWSP